MVVRPYQSSDDAQWLRMRCALWPDESPEELASEQEAWAAGDETAAFFAVEEDGSLIGFAEVSIHTDAPGCTSNRIGFLEGWYVDPAHRRQGVGRALNAAAEQWARERGCTEMASDTNESYPYSPAAHRSLGYTQIPNSWDFYKQLL